MKINQLKFGIYLSYISLFITNATNLILTPFIIRNLGQSEYGVYMLIGAFVGYIAVLDFGLGNTTVRFVAKYRAENKKKEQENFLALTFGIYIIISVIIFLIGGVIYTYLERIFGQSLTSSEIEIAKTLFLILVINLSFTLPMNSFIGIINAYERFIIPRFLTISRTIIRAILIFVLLWLGYKAIAIVLVDAILNLSMLILVMIYVFLKLKVKIYLHDFNKELIKEIFSYSALIFISVVVDQMYWRIGHLVLGVLASATEVAIFALGMSLAQYFMTFSTAISGIFLPKVTQMVVFKKSNKKLTNFLIKTGRLQFIVLGLALGGFILFGKEFLILWVGPGFEKSWIIAILVMIPLQIVLSQTVGISILQAKNMHGFRAIAYLCISILNLFISVLLSKKYGGIGAVLGTTLSLIIGNIIIMNIYYYFKVQLDIPVFFRKLFKGLLKSFVISFIFGLILVAIPINNWIAFILQCILYCIIYILITWHYGMNSYEKKLFSTEFIKLIRLFKRMLRFDVNSC